MWMKRMKVPVTGLVRLREAPDFFTREMGASPRPKERRDSIWLPSQRLTSCWGRSSLWDTRRPGKLPTRGCGAPGEAWTVRM